MKWILIGHRGVGKSQFLQRMKSYLPDREIVFLDLDQEIEKKYRRPLIHLFPQVGEAQFREIEEQVFREIDNQHRHYILSVGGGFRLDPTRICSDEIKVIWLRRKTDDNGRIFLDRPRLNAQVSPLQEFRERFEIRQKFYQACADEVYWMPEGLDTLHPVEKAIWAGAEDLSAGGVLTLEDWQLRKFDSGARRFGCQFYEIRDDLLDLSKLEWKKIPFEKRLLSFRHLSRSQESLRFLSEFCESDWALELKDSPSREFSVISSHERSPGESLAAFLLRLEKAGTEKQHLKAAPLIDSIAEAQELLRWQNENPQQRSILPRSKKEKAGCWTWLRLYQKGRQKINFWRESDGSSWDQPTLFEWLSTPDKPHGFAALIGDPVHHSRTMVEQSLFFGAQNQPVWPILLEESEFDAEALNFLISLGLQAAAVTSPLKKKAFEACSFRSAEAQRLQAVNTLFIPVSSKPSEIHGHNSDLDGFRAQIQKASDLLQVPPGQLSAAIWGGGGTLNVLQEVLPLAVQISVRTRQPRQVNEALPTKVQILVWAAGPEEDFPPIFDFEILVDLNYREDSRAREWALQKGRPYISGIEMFKAQAAGQRQYWQLMKER